MLRMLTLLVIASSSLVFGQSDWTIDSAHSAAQFSVRHMMVSNVRGQFGKVIGTAVYDPANPAAAKVEATIDATTINTREPRRDEDLRSANFFDTASYPTITFKSTKVEPLGEGHLKVTGDLTMHGVTKEVALDVTGLNTQVKDPRGNVHVGASATTRLNRKDFGINWNRALDNGGVMVADEVDVILDVEMFKKAPTT